MKFDEEFYKREMKKREQELKISKREEKIQLEEKVIFLYQKKRLPYVDIADLLKIRYAEVEEIIRKHGVEIKLKDTEKLWRAGTIAR